MIDPPHPTSPEAFLIAEFTALYDQRNALNSGTTNEVNLFFASVTAAGIATGFVASFLQDSTISFLLIACGLLVVLLLLGSITFRRVVNARVQVLIYVRGMNRIRRYFVESHKQLESYLIPPIVDDKPPFKGIGQSSDKWTTFCSTAGIVAIVNSSLAAGLVGLFLTLFHERIWTFPLERIVVTLATIVVFFLVAWVQYGWQSSEFNHAELQQAVNFPSTSTATTSL